jgi:hypothetical protein
VPLGRDRERGSAGFWGSRGVVDTFVTMLIAVLGASGSGKSAVAAPLANLLPGYVVLDWDAFMSPASELAGRDVPRSPTTWPAYGRLVRTVVDAVGSASVVLLGVCTPDELIDWPIDRWLLLDCSDDERRIRLANRLDEAEIADALADAHRYRSLGLPAVDTTGRTIDRVAAELAGAIASPEA